MTVNMSKWIASVRRCLAGLAGSPSHSSVRRADGLRRKCWAFALSGFLLWAPASLTAFANAEEALKIHQDAPLTYSVKRGDTLWDIAALFLRDPWQWPELWALNTQVDNPHLIYPGDQLTLVWEEGQPRLVRAAQGDVRLSPTLRASPPNTAVPAISRQHIAPFLRQHFVIDAGALEQAPYVVAGDAGRLLSGLGDTVYGRGDWQDARSYRLVRPVRQLEDPVTGEVLGVFVLDIAEVTRQDVMGGVNSDDPDAKVAAMVVTEMREEVRIGDKLIPITDRDVESAFQPSPPDANLNGAVMMAVAGGITQIGALDVVVVNRGQRESLKPGDVLAIDQAGQTVQDPVTQHSVRLPDTRAGVLMLFAVYERASFGLVLEATRPLAVGDKLRDPQHAASRS